MKYLRLENTKEFYKDGLPALLLGDIKTVNILIGANNTRKSRFLRNLINQDYYTIATADHALNEAMFDFDSIFTDVDKLKTNELTEPIIQFHFENEQSSDGRILKVREFCGSTPTVSISQVKDKLNNVHDTIKAIGSETQVEDLAKIIQETLTTVRLMHSIYVQAEKGLPDERDHNFLKSDIPDVMFFNRMEMFSKNFDIKLAYLTKVLSYLQPVSKIKFEFSRSRRIYIPVLRTSRMLSGVAGKDIFQDTIIDQHFKELNNKVEIHTGLKLYEKISAAKNGSRKASKDFQAFEKFIGQSFFQSDDLHIVAQYSEKGERTILISVPGEMDDVPIQDLGDGIQGIINLLFPVFTAEDGAWVFIDEPENYLHPGYQRIFIQALTENETIKAKKLRFFINTHSNHILAGALFGKSTEIWVFKRHDASSSQISAFNGTEYSTLQLLGVINTSVLISNCTVWVEGVTDRFYIQAFLFAYSNSLDKATFRPTEGLHFSFLEYGGKNILHYNFDHDLDIYESEDYVKSDIEAYFLNSNVFVLADSDFDAEKNNRFKSIKRDTFRFEETNVPEIENIIPQDILQDFLVEHLNYKRADVSKHFPLNTKELKLGKALSGKFEYGKSYRKFEAKTGGTLRSDYKKALADFVHSKVIEKKYTWDSLKTSPELVRIITEIYKFVKEKNS